MRIIGTALAALAGAAFTAGKSVDVFGHKSLDALKPKPHRRSKRKKRRPEGHHHESRFTRKMAAHPGYHPGKLFKGHRI